VDKPSVVTQRTDTHTYSSVQHFLFNKALLQTEIKAVELDKGTQSFFLLRKNYLEYALLSSLFVKFQKKDIFSDGSFRVYEIPSAHKKESS
ncbi:hypothetical protein AVEN_55108-1, partial [Araneus ventricosus]